MPAIAFTGKGASKARVFVATFTETDINVADAVQADKKGFERIGIVKRGEKSFMIVILRHAIPISNFKRTLENNFDVAKFNFSAWEAMDALHLSQLGWGGPQPEETFRAFTRTNNREVQKIVVPALRNLSDDELANYDNAFLEEVVAFHLGMRALLDCEHKAMTRYDKQNHNPFLWQGEVLVKRSCNLCNVEIEAHRACPDCKRVWCHSCGAEEKTKTTNSQEARKLAKKLQPEVLQVETGEWWPNPHNLVIEVTQKLKIESDRKLRHMLETAPHLNDGATGSCAEQNLESLVAFYKVYRELFDRCHKDKFQCWNSMKSLFEQFVNEGRHERLEVPLLQSKDWEPNLKAELESIRDGTELLKCRCGNVIQDDHALCSECRRPSKCRACKKGFNQAARTEHYKDVPDSHPLKKLMQNRKRQCESIFYTMYGICSDCLWGTPMSSWPQERPNKRARR